jgi:hypothetical protein
MELRLNTTADTLVAWMIDWTRSCALIGVRTPLGSWLAGGASEVQTMGPGRRLVFYSYQLIGSVTGSLERVRMSLSGTYQVDITPLPAGGILVAFPPVLPGTAPSEYFNRLAMEIATNWPEAVPQLAAAHREAATQRSPDGTPETGAAKGQHTESPPGGRPPLRRRDRNEYLHRLMMAMKAEEYRNSNPEATWHDVARAIHWDRGLAKNGVKMLQRACDLLAEATPEDRAEASVLLRQKPDKKDTN